MGLFGVHSSTRRVRSVIAAAIASRSCSPAAVSGTGTGVPPWEPTRIGYASKERQAKTTSSPSPTTARTRSPETATEPVDSAICAGSTPCFCPSAARSCCAEASG